MMTDSAPVPRFALFGENTGSSFEDLVHCETIQVRSSRYDWEISPHRHPSLCQVLLVLSGGVEFMLAELLAERTGPVLLLTPPGTVHGFRFDREAQGYVVTLSDRFAKVLRDDEALDALLSKPDVLEPGAALAARLQAICEQMLLADGPGAGADLLRRALAEAFLRMVAEIGADPTQGRSDELVDRFRTLVQDHLREQRSLGFFAERLNATERTLSRRVRAALGISPGQYLNDRIAAEATRLLRFTNASCSNVADELGFADPSYFSRFYARITGRRPSAVRGSLTGTPPEH